MKKFWCIAVVTAVLVSAMTSCVTQEDNSSSPASVPSPDSPPVLSVSPGKVTVDAGEGYVLSDGVTGYDEEDGNITDSIVTDGAGFDPDKAGVYIITYTLTDSSGNKVTAEREITVNASKITARPPVWTGEIEGEIKNPADPKVYGGAWYHKVVSSKDQWVGIEATVTLPEFDIERYGGDYDSSLDADPAVKNLDNPSVYFGGNAKNESDVGLSLSRVNLSAGGTNISTGSVAFRPFWRYITSVDQDLGDYSVHGGEYAVSANGNNCFANYHWKYTEYYYLPGDKLRIIVTVPEPDKMQLQIEVIEKSALESSVAMRKKYGWKDPADFVSPVFTSPGHGTGMNAEYKRVNAIDQTANEGGTAIATSTEVTNAVWHETYLYRVIDGTLYRVPMTPERMGVRNAPEDAYISVTYDGVDRNVGGEVVTIHPGYENK